MAVNLTRAWTGSTIAPQSTPAAPPAAVPGSNVPAAVTNAGFNLGQNQSAQFYNNLLSQMFGMNRGQPSGPQMSPAQSSAIQWGIIQQGAEQWNRQKEEDIRRGTGSVSPAGFSSLTGVSPIMSPLGGGLYPVFNPFAEQALSSARLAPSAMVGASAAGFGGMGPVGAQPVRSAWTAPAFGF